jgi:hypothetical protein
MWHSSLPLWWYRQLDMQPRLKLTRSRVGHLSVAGHCGNVHELEKLSKVNKEALGRKSYRCLDV